MTSPSAVQVLVFGPLVETLLLLAATQVAHQALGAVALPRLTCAWVVGTVFWLCHVVQNGAGGAGSWAAPVGAFMLAAVAARHAGRPLAVACREGGPVLLAAHVAYNAGVLVLTQAQPMGGQGPPW